MIYDKTDYTWNYFTYMVVNTTTGRTVDEYEDKDYAKKVCKRLNAEGQYKYIVQQLHSIAKVI